MLVGTIPRAFLDLFLSYLNSSTVQKAETSYARRLLLIANCKDALEIGMCGGTAGSPLVTADAAP